MNDGLGLDEVNKLPHGMIVITGPTGSGKTTTLATILSILNEPTRKILTIEDLELCGLPKADATSLARVCAAVGLMGN